MARHLNYQRYAGIEDAVWAQVWWTYASNGVIWLPWSIGDTWAETLCMVLRDWREQENLELIIDCTGGDRASFEPCKLLLERRERGLRTKATVIGEAGSIALSYVVVCTERLAIPEAQFMAHGEQRRDGARHESGAYLEDHYAADWLGRFTKQSYEWWLEYLGDGKSHSFGVSEALKWGVIDEVLPGV